ncbi:MAG: hypothetical protein GY859_13640 [Desulfobacterales bacterium]|nr:hypothetical protein [Desulfobacterales bacterium]
MRTRIQFIAAIFFCVAMSACATATAPPNRGEEVDVCFYNFTEVFEKRIYPTLKETPGVADVREAYGACDARSVCVCYELTRSTSDSGSMEELMTWLRRRLRTSRVLPFRMTPISDNLLEVRFNAGFDD